MPWGTGLQSYNVIADPKIHDTHLKQNTVDATVLMIQAI